MDALDLARIHSAGLEALIEGACTYRSQLAHLDETLMDLGRCRGSPALIVLCDTEYLQIRSHLFKHIPRYC